MFITKSIIISICLASIELAASSKLNVPRVLLPYNHDFPSNYTLRVYDGGCYTWTSTSNDVVLEEVNAVNGCASEVIVSAITKSSLRHTAIVIAKDTVSGLSFRCDVIIDSFHRLEIVTTTRELYVEEAPEEFEVRAYDEQGNEFSTLEGLEFVWDLQTITDYDAVVPAQTVLRFMTFSASPYEVPHAIASLEDDGRQSYKVLIEGRQTGLARLSVRMPHSSYRELPPSSVNLMVIANLILEPQDVYILVQTTVIYSVFNLKHGIFHLIELDGSQYSLHVNIPDIGILEDDGISVTGLERGTTEVVLRDNNVKTSQTIKQPTANLHVVEPSYMTITVEPYNNPVLINGNEYVFLVHVFDKDGNKIFLAPTIRVESSIPEEYVTTRFISTNGTYLEGQPIKTGTTKMTAVLSGIQVGYRILEISPPLKASLTLEIYDRIRVIPPLTILPWDPVTLPRYEVNLTAVGATGLVKWSSNDSLSSVTQSGLCKTKGEGTIKITAALQINLHNKDHGQIVIQDALGLDLLESVVEIEVYKPLLLPLSMNTLYGGVTQTFNACDKLMVNIATSEASFDHLSSILPPSFEGACAMVQVTGNSPGFTQVTATYSRPMYDLKSEITVAAYNPLRPLNPESGETVLALGSSRIVLFDGGPLPWIHKPSGHFTKISLNTSEYATAELLSKPALTEHRNIHAVMVECHELGSTNLTIEVGNKPSKVLRFPIVVSVNVTVICALPDSVMISQRDVKDGCPAMNDFGMVVAPSNYPFPVKVSVYDSEGRLFDNISSLALEWTVSNVELGHISESVSLVKEQNIQGFPVPLIAEGSLVPSGHSGNMSVKIMLNGYADERFVFNILPELSASLPIMLVNEVEINPSYIVLFNHLENQGEFTVKGGSGYFQLQNLQDGVVTLSYNKNRKITVVPLTDGNSSANLMDLCIDRPPVVAPIHVASLLSLDLIMTDKMQLDSTIDVKVIVSDAHGSHVPYHSLMDLQPHKHTSIIDVVYNRIDIDGNAIYRVRGLSIGDTSLRISASNSVFSPARPLQVFPPLDVQPKNITLIVGALFQVEVFGGPYPDANIEFVMKNESVATSSHAGLITAIALGNTVLTASAVAHNANDEPYYAQDTVFVYVVPLPKIRIEAPLQRLEIGSSMPVYAMGSDENLTPMAYATAIPPLVFEWQINNKAIGSLSKVYQDNGVNEGKENAGIVRLNALMSGRVTISLKVKVSITKTPVQYQIQDNIVLTDKLEVKFFETLKLKIPNSEDAKLLMTPNSETKIITNREGEGKLSYKVDCSNGERKPIEVSNEGIVQAKSELGDFSVVVTLEESFGVSQSMVVLVEVREVKYIQASAQPFMQLSTASTTLPMGITHTLKISHHDNRGRIFDAVTSKLGFRPSRFDLLSITPGSSNTSLSVSVKDQGQTVLNIWDAAHNGIKDFVKINSGAGILPDKPNIPVGFPVCLTSPMLGMNGNIGVWSSSDRSVLTFDFNSSIGVSYGIGKAIVTYEVSTTVRTSIEVIVSPITGVSASQPTETFSNIQRKVDYLVPIHVRTEMQQEIPHCFPEIENVLIDAPFTCHLSFKPRVEGVDAWELFEAVPVYVPGKGFHCALRSRFFSFVPTAPFNAALYLEIIAASHATKPGVSVNTGEVAVPFHFAATPDRMDVTLTEKDTAGAIRVTGSKELIGSLHAIPDDMNLLTATFDVVDDITYELTITAKDSAWGGGFNQTWVNIVSTLTHQETQINVSLDQTGTGGTCINPSRTTGYLQLLWYITKQNQGTIMSIISAILLIVGVTIAYRFIFGPGYRQTSQAGVLAASKGPPPPFYPSGASPKSPTSPYNASSMGDNSFSRRPQMSPSNIPLWSVDREPVYGDPMFRTSPKLAYEGSSTYTTRS